MRLLAGAALWAVCAFAAAWPAVADVLPLGDDDTAEVVFTGGFSFPFFGTRHDSVFVNSNGNLTFGRGDVVSIPEETGFLGGPPRIAPLWADLTPNLGGSVLTAETAGSFTVTFNQVPLFGEILGNTFTVTLFDDGSFEFDYAAVTFPGFPLTDWIAGYSAGVQVTRGDEGAVDLSGASRPVGNGSRPAIHEVFTAASPFDLSGQRLLFRPTWAWLFFHASDTSGGNLLRINGWTGGAEVIGPLGFARVGGLSFSPGGVLYGVDTSGFPLSATLVTVDPATGAASAVGPLGFPVVNCLAFAPDGTLFGVELDPDIEETNLLVIDPATGAASVRAPMVSTDVSALAFTPEGTLYAVDDDTDRLLEVDPATGAETPVGPLGFDGGKGLAATPDGRLFAVREDLVVGEGFHTFLLEVDPATGAASELGGTEGAAGEGLAHRCEPTNGGAELCDALDNDCDGLTDEDFPAVGGPCSAGLGECLRDGFLVCALDGGDVLCDAVPGLPATEICNGLDDDCDGTVEDDLDEDEDGWSLCDGDCDDSDGGSVREPGEVGDLRFQDGWILWEDLGPVAGPGTRYDLVVAASPDFSDARCLHGDLPLAGVQDLTVPPVPPSVLYFLVRGQNGCADGDYGADSEGVPRIVAAPDCF